MTLVVTAIGEEGVIGIEPLAPRKGKCQSIKQMMYKVFIMHRGMNTASKEGLKRISMAFCIIRHSR